MPIPTQTTAVESGRLLLADVVYERLLTVIVSGDLAPGEVVREEEIGEWLGVSRTPVRDAMRRLGEQDLLVYQPNRGSRVAPLDGARLAQILEVTAALEGMAARLAVARSGPDERATIRARVRALADEYRAGVGPHDAADAQAVLTLLVERCDNPVLQRTIGHLTPHQRRLQALCPTYFSEPEIRTATDAILGALDDGDAEGVGYQVQAYCLQLGRRLLAAAGAAALVG
ncbi:GntR family transcriptional regulator [Cellulomonas composti]|uniref:Putative transcriptional regulator, GntR family protein n=1 Tax=Cellulomonas composti TaxID=266130 RepID=A0A511JBR7_9CELL|nr:GntR family transcriptional regulator [Cellulomonas composti]GEL95430.1 putative transcriptional regulator, GntR family protein [Cellulomonas composti]